MIALQLLNTIARQRDLFTRFSYLNGLSRIICTVLIVREIQFDANGPPFAFIDSRLHKYEETSYPRALFTKTSRLIYEAALIIRQVCMDYIFLLMVPMQSNNNKGKAFFKTPILLWVIPFEYCSPPNGLVYSYTVHGAGVPVLHA